MARRNSPSNACDLPSDNGRWNYCRSSQITHAASKRKSIRRTCELPAKLDVFLTKYRVCDIKRNRSPEIVSSSLTLIDIVKRVLTLHSRRLY